MGTWLPETCRDLEQICKKKELRVKLVIYKNLFVLHFTDRKATPNDTLFFPESIAIYTSRCFTEMPVFWERVNTLLSFSIHHRGQD